ncbi:MAG TPA: hypothetical protein VG028_01975 [Terriglobia bacterium]|nr:hypothetical protein [Terriglobia bacterium]
MSDGNFKKLALELLDLCEKSYLDAAALRVMVDAHGVSDVDLKLQLLRHNPAIADHVRSTFAGLRTQLEQAKDEGTLDEAFLKCLELIPPKRKLI